MSMKTDSGTLDPNSYLAPAQPNPGSLGFRGETTTIEQELTMIHVFDTLLAARRFMARHPGSTIYIHSVARFEVTI